MRQVCHSGIDIVVLRSGLNVEVSWHSNNTIVGHIRFYALDKRSEVGGITYLLREILT